MAVNDGTCRVPQPDPEHRPGSWLSGRPWDDRPSPARDVLPERKPDTTPEQRLREAADRIRGGWI